MMSGLILEGVIVPEVAALALPARTTGPMVVLRMLAIMPVATGNPRLLNSLPTPAPIAIAALVVFELFTVRLAIRPETCANELI